LSRSSAATVPARFQPRQSALPLSDRVSTFFARERLANEVNSVAILSRDGPQEFRF
jgi:hypothetical protein